MSTAVLVELLLAASALSLIAPTVADGFTEPPGDDASDFERTYIVGRKYRFMWSTSVDYINMTVTPWGKKDETLDVLLNDWNPSTLSWTVGNYAQLVKNNKFAFQIRDKEGQQLDGDGWVDGVLSSYGFYIEADMQASSSSIAASSSSTTIPTSTPQASVLSVISVTTTTSSVATSSVGAPTAASAQSPLAPDHTNKASLAVGLGVGLGAAVIGLLAIFLLRRHWRGYGSRFHLRSALLRKDQSKGEEESKVSTRQIQELAGDSNRCELYGDGNRWELQS